MENSDKYIGAASKSFTIGKANLEVKADDFRIYWDNAYCIHHLSDEPDKILNILDECRKLGKENMVLMFASTSKVTFPGAGIACIGASKENIDYIKSKMTYQCS